MLRALEALPGAASPAQLLSPSTAAALDAADELVHLRAHFRLPPHGAAGRAAVYLCGNSLGLQPAGAAAAVHAELERWAALGVEAHFTPPHAWVTADEDVRRASERLVGAARGAGEVVCMNGLTVNLHLFLLGFYRPPPLPQSTSAAAETAAAAPAVLAPRGRHKILIEAHAFPSDTYAVKSQLALHGRDARTSLVLVAPRPGEHELRTEDVLAAVALHADELALVLLPGVQYYSGQRMDIARITAATREAGAVSGWDLAHAVGNVELRLHEWGVDFACWCAYKYLNGGPGGLAGAFLHSRHGDTPFGARPHLAGWWGHRKSDRFLMGDDFAPSPGAAGWQLCNPPVLAVAALRASLEVFDHALCGGAPQPASSSASAPSAHPPAPLSQPPLPPQPLAPVPDEAEADWTRLASKSRALTGYLERLLDATVVARGEARIITPRDPGARGAQLSLLFLGPAASASGSGSGAGAGKGGLPVRELARRLALRGCVVDVREPACVRVAPCPLYNSAEDVRAFAQALDEEAAAMRAEEGREGGGGERVGAAGEAGDERAGVREKGDGT